MDNITHTLIGLAQGEIATQLHSKRTAKTATGTRALFWGVSAAANNFPDLDQLYSGLTERPLGYLLHHRGHTHTLGGIVLQYALLTAVSVFFLGRRDLKWICGLIAVGLGLHVTMDFLNSYGVHPLWPFNNDWLSGDTLFIIEPWIWISLLPALIWAAPRTWIRHVLVSTLLLGIGLCVFSGYVPWQMTLLLVLQTAWLTGLMFKLKARGRIATAVAATIGVIAVFGAISTGARADLLRILSRQFPHSTVRDIALSPYPANPLCWSVNTVEVDNGVYYARKGVYAAFPRTFGAGLCPELFAGKGLAELEPVPAPARPELLWLGQFRSTLASLDALKAEYCLMREFLRFARVPFWRQKGRNDFVAGDLRFDRGDKQSFAVLHLGQEGLGRTCPNFVPPWKSRF